VVELFEGKAFPLQTWTGLEGSRRQQLPDFLTRHKTHHVTSVQSTRE